MLSSSIFYAQQGIQWNMQKFAEAANRISNPDINAGIREIMEMKEAEHGLKVNVAVLRRANEMSDFLIDVLA